MFSDWTDSTVTMFQVKKFHWKKKLNADSMYLIGKKKKNTILCFSYHKFLFNANVTLKCQSGNESHWVSGFLLYKMMMPCYLLPLHLHCWISKDRDTNDPVYFSPCKKYPTATRIISCCISTKRWATLDKQKSSFYWKVFQWQFDIQATF